MPAQITPSGTAQWDLKNQEWWGKDKGGGGGGGSSATPAASTTPSGFGVRTSTGPLPKIALIGGTGRMGVHLCAAWANAGYEVTMCSRTQEKAQKIVESLLAGNGYREDGMQGGIQVPPCPAEGWKLKAGTNDDAAQADLIVLATMYEQAWGLLEGIAPKIRGKGKIILDMTNPFLKRPDGCAPLPSPVDPRTLRLITDALRRGRRCRPAKGRPAERDRGAQAEA